MDLAAPSAASRPKQTLSRFTTTPVVDCCRQDHSRDSSPHSSHSPASQSRTSSRRPSFGSIKEDVTGIAQSFVDTEPPQPSEGNASPASPTASELEMQAPDFCCPCGGFLGWKQIRLGGRSLSRSYSDLRFLGNAQSKGWAWEVTKPRAPQKTEEQEVTKAGRSSLEKLPAEVLDQVISHLALDVPPNGYTPRNVDLISCLLTSKTLHAATLSVLYRNITIPHSIIFSKALNHISQYPALGTLVRRLDFSHFTSVGLGRTKQMNVEIQNLTAKTLLKCLDLLPYLKECLLQEHVETDIDVPVLRKLFTGLPNLQAVDFCGCSTQAFSASFVEALMEGLPPALPMLKRVSLHECSSLPAVAFEILLPRLVNVTHLDLAHTQITEAALFSIPDTARITHLNLSRCSRLTGPKVVEFLTTHPAVRESLVYLNLQVDISRYRLLDGDDVTALLPKLPSTLRSLNLGGARISSEHVPALIPLTKHLEELGLGAADLSVADINSFFVAPKPSPAPSPEKAADSAPTPAVQTPWVPPTLHYLDLTKVPSMTLAVIFNTNACVLIAPQTQPLEVLEFGDKIITLLRERTSTKAKIGWAVRELGRRGWFVREPSGTHRAADDGSRWWKMGARWWGMRKIPVAVGDVGGIYGHYMFKK
ncbi:hypothetical protein DTO271D3_1174 [Paecilomyces variotii]|nr:hypothetical protein DTO271D3_1174 [Paecilomyces variotii]